MNQADQIAQRVQVEVSRVLLAEPPAPGKIHDLVAAQLKAEFKTKGATSKDVIGGACRAAMAAVVLSGRDAAEGAVEIVQAVVDIVQERSGDPMRTLGYALEGIAASAAAGGRQEVGRIGMAIDAKFMGAGSIFSEYAAKSK